MQHRLPEIQPAPTYPTLPYLWPGSQALPYLPYLTLPYPTSGWGPRALPHLPYLTLPYPTSGWGPRALPYLPYLTLPYPTPGWGPSGLTLLTLPYPTLPCTFRLSPPYPPRMQRPVRAGRAGAGRDQGGR
jgi:hypothetical protein